MTKCSICIITKSNHEKQNYFKAEPIPAKNENKECAPCPMLILTTFIIYFYGGNNTCITA